MKAFVAFGAILAVFFAGAGAPTPLYLVYQDAYGFSAITLTLVFAVYVLALLVALVVAGRVSDHAGRKRVLVVALVLQLVGMAAFLLADATGWLLAARALQGLATGLATSTLSAALLDTEPRPGIGSIVASAAPLLGLSGGALGAALLVDLGPDPTHLVFWVLTGAYVAALAGLVLLPEPLEPDGRWRAALRPRVAVPRTVRATFVAVAPCLVATWSLGGLYLSLGPSLTALLTGSDSHVIGGLVVVALMGTGGVTAALSRPLPAERLMLGGAGFVMAGVAITLAAVATGSTVLLLLGSFVAGIGFGPAFAGVLRVLTGRIDAHERAGLMSAVYVVSYTAFSAPAVLAGVAETHYGLRPTALVYGAVVIVLAASATVAFGLQLRRAPVVPA